ncbi:armadillo-type protein [Melampsora americana]|nr:armadillo-type protein [Melampsora americana]
MSTTRTTRDFNNWRRGPGPLTEASRPSRFGLPNTPERTLLSQPSHVNPLLHTKPVNYNSVQQSLNSLSWRTPTRFGPRTDYKSSKDREARLEVAPKQVWSQVNEGDESKKTERKATALLNKLTMKNFQSISDQILEIIKTSKDSKQDELAKIIFNLIFKKSLDEHKFCEIYAQLVKKIFESVATPIINKKAWSFEKEEDLQLIYKKFLLDQCQTSFDSTWPNPLKLNKSSEIKIEIESKETFEEFTEEYYEDQKKKRQRIGLINLIGELFKLDIVAAKIIDICCSKLLSKVNDALESDIECACALIMKVGKKLDQRDPKPLRFEQYLQRLDQIANSQPSTSRIKFMIMVRLIS